MSFKRVKVVMLPTNEKAQLWLSKGNALTLWGKENNNDKLGANQHLYFLSDEEIKEGDWYISAMKSIISQHNGTEKLPDGWKKIIATTDKSLEISNNLDYNQLLPNRKDFRFYLPHPSQQFIEKYIEEYNKGNVITDVLIEYELISNEEYFGNTVNPDDDVPYFDEKLKINPKDNTITIRKTKDSWNREEVVKLLEEIHDMSYENCQYDYSLTATARYVNVDKWIEENL